MGRYRLTGRNEFGEVTSYNAETDHVAGDKEIRSRLAEYEDAGLAPEQIFQVCDMALYEMYEKYCLEK